MTPLQEKAINEALRLLDTVTGQPFWVNSENLVHVKIAAEEQRASCMQDSYAKSQAMEWLRAALKS